jgi:Cof subfamily protein (haloacid dehalogenase superfamily)
MRIQLLALDLDQTILGTDLVVSNRVLQAISRAQAAGVVVTIATGREATLAARFAMDLKVTAPIICNQGACIYDPSTSQKLHDVRLSMEMLPRMLESAKRRRWNIHFDVSDQLFFPKESSHPAVIFELLRYSNWVRVVDLSKALPEPPTKLVVTVERVEDRARVVEEMETDLGDCLTPVPSHPHLVEGLPHGVHKGHGLAWLAERLGIEQSRTMGIGDSEADIPMLRWAGLGVAMGNAAPDVKAAADWVAPSLEEDGAAVAIERFVLEETEPSTPAPRPDSVR